MSDFPSSVLITARVKQFRDRAIDGERLPLAELLELIGSHEQLRALALSRTYRLRAVEEERSRLQGQIELLAMAHGRKGR